MVLWSDNGKLLLKMKQQSQLGLSSATYVLCIFSNCYLGAGK